MKTFSLDAELRGHPDFPFGIGRAVLDREGFVTHCHDYSELVIITGGTGIHRMGRISYPVGAGDIFVIRQGESHGFEDCRRLGMANISFASGFPSDQGLRDIEGVRLLFVLEPRFRTAGEPGGMFHAAPLQMERISAVCAEMEKELKNRAQGWETMFRIHLTGLMVLLGRYYTDREFAPSRRLKRLASCLAEMEEGFDKDIDLGVLARTHGYSSAHFIRLFRKIYHTTPRQYILQMRIARAAELLRTGDLSISEIAWQCGFADSNYFSRAFRKRMGISPRRFRSGDETAFRGPDM